MKVLSRRSFCKYTALGTSIALLKTPNIVAFADDGLIELEPESFMAEINSWYHSNGLSVSLDSIEGECYRLTIDEFEQVVNILQSFYIAKSVEHSSSFSIDSENNVSPCEIMPINFTRTNSHTLNCYFEGLVPGSLHVNVSISATIDAARDNIISSSGTAYETSSMNLDSVSFGTVSTSNNSPSSGSISYSVPCTAKFKWTVNSLTFSNTMNETFTGSVSF